MTNPKFKTGDTVYIERTLSIPAGAYLIVRVMPEEKGSYSYRVRGVSDTTERIVGEGDIKNAM